MSEAIIYQHFATKQALYDAIIAHAIEKRREFWDATRPPSRYATLDAQLRHFALTYIRSTREDPTFLRLMMYSALEDTKFRERFFDASRPSYLRAVRQVLEAGMARGAYRKVDARLALRGFLWSVIQYCVSNIISVADPGTPKQETEWVDTMVAVFVDGLRTSRCRTEATGRAHGEE